MIIDTISKIFTKTKNTLNDNYLLEITLGDQKYTANGKDHNIFNNIKIKKITNKSIIKMSKGDKSFEIPMSPFQLKKLIINKNVKLLQFKRFSAKLN